MSLAILFHFLCAQHHFTFTTRHSPLQLHEKKIHHIHLLVFKFEDLHSYFYQKKKNNQLGLRRRGITQKGINYI